MCMCNLFCIFSQVVRERNTLNHLSESFKQEDGLASALKEITNLTKKFAEEKAEYEQKVSEEGFIRLAELER